MKITKITDEYIEFDDNSRITFDHCQECCECNYADFRQLADTGVEQEDFKLPLQFERAGVYGFRFGNPGKMYFVPCYSDQNGYYTNEVDIHYQGQQVLEAWGELI